MMTTEADISSEDNRPPQPTGGRVLGSSGGNGDLSVGEDASLKNSVKLREWVGSRMKSKQQP